MKKLFGFLLTVLIITIFAVSSFAAQVLLNPKFQALDDNGDLLSGGKVYAYAAGTTSAKDTYTDSTLGTPNANPVVLDSRGEADIYLSGSYKIILKDSDDVTIWTLDNVEGQGSTIVDFTLLSEYADLAAAITAIGATETTLWLDDTQAMDENVTLPVTLSVIGMKGHKITTTGYTFTINGSFEAGRYQVFSGTGSVVYGPTSLSDMSYPEWFGENTTPGTTVMDEEIQDAIEMVEGRTYGGTVSFDSNIYLADTTIDIVSDYVRLIGQGHGTTIQRTGDYGCTFDFDDASAAQYFCEIAHMTIEQKTNPMSTGAHIRVDNPYYFKAHDLFIKDGYIGIDQLAGINNRYTDIEVQVSETLYPTGSEAHSYFRLWKSADRANSSSVWITRFDGSSSINSDAHVLYGLLITSCDGVWLDESHIQGGSTANIYISPSDADSPIGGIRISNSWLDPPGDEIAGGHNSIVIGGATTGNYGWINISNNVIDGGNRNNYGIHINSGDVEDIHITDNHITRCGLTGIWAQSFDSDLEIRDNTISGNNYKESAGGYGVLITADLSNFDITDNTIGGGPLGVAGRQKYGIAVASGTGSNYIITGNNCAGNVTGGISDGGTGVNRVVANNSPIVTGGLASGVYDFAVHTGAVASYPIGYLPDNAVITRAYYQVITDPAGAGSSIAIGIPTDDAAGIVAATAFDNAIWDLGCHEAIQLGTVATFSERTTAVRAVQVTISGAVLTAGKIKVWWEYVVGE